MGKSSGSKNQAETERKEKSKKPRSNALANLMSYENEDSESANEDSNDAQTLQPPPPPTLAGGITMQPRSVLGKSPVKFALKSRFDKIQTLGIRPKASGQGTIRVASKWDDPDDETDNVIHSLEEGSRPSGIKKPQLYESGCTTEGTPLVNEPTVGRMTSCLAKPLATEEVKMYIILYAHFLT